MPWSDNTTDACFFRWEYKICFGRVFLLWSGGCRGVEIVFRCSDSTLLNLLPLVLLSYEFSSRGSRPQFSSRGSKPQRDARMERRGLYCDSFTSGGSTALRREDFLDLISWQYGTAVMPIPKQPPATSGGWHFTTMGAELRLLLQWDSFFLVWIVGATL